MAEAGVQFDEVSYTLPDGRALLRDITLMLAAGTTTALLGRSGSGKTTLLRMVNGLVRPTAGRVLTGGVDVGELTGDALIALRRRTGYVIQETGLFPHMTVQRNAGMALELAKSAGGSEPGGCGGIDRPGRDEHRVNEALGLAGLNAGEFAKRYPWQLSGGQRQRVGLARALAADPPVLLLDEPFGALDPMTRSELQTTLRDLLARLEKTVLVVTHDLDEALYLAERVVLLEQGEVVADLAAGEVLASENAHVKAYIRAVHRADDGARMGA